MTEREYFPKPDGWQPNGEPGQCQAWATTRGRQCTQSPMTAQRVCKKHGGKSPQAIAGAERRQAVADIHAEVDRELRLGQFELGQQVDHLQAFCDLLVEDQAYVRVLRECVARLEPRYTTTAEGDAVGIAGPNHLGDGAPHVFVVMYDQALDRLARHLKLAHDAGIQQREIDLAERLGGQLAQVIQGLGVWIVEALRRAGVAAEAIDVVEAEFPTAVRTQLQLVAGSSP